MASKVERSRRVAIEKRSENLNKKARELSVLTGADVCLINIPPAGDRSAALTWPQDRSEIDRILGLYHNPPPLKKRTAGAVARSAQLEAPAREAAATVARAGQIDGAKKDKKKKKEKYPLVLPCTDDWHKMSSMVDELDTNLMEIKNKIKEIKCASMPEAALTPEAAVGSSAITDYNELNPDPPVEAPEPLSVCLYLFGQQVFPPQ